MNISEASAVGILLRALRGQGQPQDISEATEFLAARAANALQVSPESLLREDRS